MKLNELEQAAKATNSAPAFKDGVKPGPRTDPVQVRPAGPEGMADEPEDWDEVDQNVDESFPASDPPSYSRPERPERGSKDD